MDLETLSEALRASLEALRTVLLQQAWLGFAHNSIAEADVSTIWTMVVVALVPIVLGIVILWPVRRKMSAIATGLPVRKSSAHSRTEHLPPRRHPAGS
jgi:hypothetical protein